MNLIRRRCDSAFPCLHNFGDNRDEVRGFSSPRLPPEAVSRSLLSICFIFLQASPPAQKLTHKLYLHNFSFHVFVVKAGCRCGYFNRTPTWHRHT